MLVVEMNVINAAKAWKRAETAEKRKHWEKMLRIAIEALESHERKVKKPPIGEWVSTPGPKKKTTLRIVK